MILESLGAIPVAHAESVLGLEIFDIKFKPMHPIITSSGDIGAVIWDAVTVEVWVENPSSNTGPSAPTTLSLEWDCGNLSRAVEAGLEPGEPATVIFERALIFIEPGTYEITARVDDDSKPKNLEVVLREEEETPPAKPDAWGDEFGALACPDNELMAIGRKKPLVLDDRCPDQAGPGDNHGCPPVAEASNDRDGDNVDNASDRCPDEWGLSENNGCPPALAGPLDADGDGILERLSREIDPCRRGDNQATDPGCQVYLRGQKQDACGTTSLAYVLRYFGVNCWPDNVDDCIRDTTAIDMFSEPIGLQEYAKSKGLNAEIYINGSLQEVRSLVERGIPVMLNIASSAGSTDVNDGHWVVVLSFCEVAQDFPADTQQTIIVMYDPDGRQFGITPDRLEKFWGKLVYLIGDADIYLWTRLYIAISDHRLPPGNTDDVRAQLSLAQGIAIFMKGGEEIADIFEEGEFWRAGEGVVEVAGGLVTTIGGALSLVVGWGEEDVPLIGGYLGSLSDLGGSLTLVTEDLVNSVADLLNPLNWADPEKMAALITDLAGAVVDSIVAIGKSVLSFIVDGIGGFFKSLWDGIKSVACKWFGRGCPKKVVYYKHYDSTDSCLESTIFINGFRRVEALGYIYTVQVPDTKPIWLYAPWVDSELSPSQRKYYLRDDGDWSQTDPHKVNMGIIGYSLIDKPSGEYLDLTWDEGASGYAMHGGGELGYLSKQPSDDTTIYGLCGRWIMAPMRCPSIHAP
jgi:hypothetical protein